MARKQSSPKKTPTVSAPAACERTFSRSFSGSGPPALALGGGLGHRGDHRADALRGAADAVRPTAAVSCRISR